MYVCLFVSLVIMCWLFNSISIITLSFVFIIFRKLCLLLLGVIALILSPQARMEFDGHLKALQGRLKSISKSFSKNTGALATEYAEKVCAQLLAASPAARFHVGRLEVESDETALRKCITLINAKCPAVAILLFSSDPNEKVKKLLITSNVPKELISKLKAGEWVKEVAACCGGKGGGKPELANAYGTDLSKYDEAVAFATEFAQNKLKQ